MGYKIDWQRISQFGKMDTSYYLCQQFFQQDDLP